AALFFGGYCGYQGGADDDCREEGGREQCTSHLLCHHRQLHEPEAATTEILVECHPEPAEFTQLRPQRRVEARLGLHRFPDHVDRRPLVQPLADIATDLLVLVGEGSTHRVHRTVAGFRVSARSPRGIRPDTPLRPTLRSEGSLV